MQHAVDDVIPGANVAVRSSSVGANAGTHTPGPTLKPADTPVERHRRRYDGHESEPCARAAQAQ